MIIQQQRATYDCVPASLCTLLQLDYDATWPAEFLNKIDSKGGCYGDDMEYIFQTVLKMEQRVDYWTVYCWNISPDTLKNLLRGRRALLQTPSLNNPPPAMHMVAWMGDKLYDPSNKKTYTYLENLDIKYVYLFNEMK